MSDDKIPIRAHDSRVPAEMIRSCWKRLCCCLAWRLARWSWLHSGGSTCSTCEAVDGA